MTRLEIDIDALRRCTLAQLERLFVEPVDALSAPSGLYRGVYLKRLHNRGARLCWARWSQTLGFERTPFGVDFDSRAWFFFDRRLQLGRFRVDVAPSRWRDTRALTLRYERSRLPAPIRGLLYDEVKPLSPTLCLGLGGINAERDMGDHFFFALARVAPPY